MITQTGKTATEAAKELGCSVATISRWASRLNVGKRYGYALVLSRADIEKIQKNWQPGRGCKPQ